MIIRNGFRMVAMGESEEAMTKDKRNLIYSAVGLGLIIVADTLINNVFYKLDLTRYPTTGGAAPAIDLFRRKATRVDTGL